MVKKIAMMARITRATKGPKIIMEKEIVTEEARIYGQFLRMSWTMNTALSMARTTMQESTTLTL
eukprot:2893344-Ditylum_brightwellii.AAC.1